MKFSVTLAVFTGFVAAGPVARRAPAKSTGRNSELSKTKRAFGDFGGSSGRGSQGGFGGAVPETDPDAFVSPFTGLGDPSTLRPVGQKRQDFPQGLLGPDFDDDEFSSSQGGFGGAVPETDPDAFASPFTGLGDPSTLRPVGQKRQDFPQGLLGPDFDDDEFSSSQGGFGGAVPETDPDAFVSPFTGLGDPSTLRPVGQKRQDFPQGLLGPDFDDDEFSSSQGGFGGAVPETDPDAFVSPFTGLGDPSTLRPVGQKRQDFPQGLLGPDFNDDDFQVNDLLPFDRPQGQDPEEVLHQNGLVDPSKLPPLTDEQSARLASLGLARH